MQIKVETELCTGCQTCISSCPYDALEMKNERAFVNEYCRICRLCLNVCPEGAIKELEIYRGVKPAIDLNSYKGVMVFAEQRHGNISAVSFELLGAGRSLADKLDVSLTCALFGANKEQADELIKYGADTVYLCDDSSLINFNDEPYTELLTNIIEQNKPEIVLAGATAIGRSFLPRVACRLHAGLTADCTSLDIDGESRDLLAVRPAFGGNIMATIVCPQTRPQMATVRPKVMKKGQIAENRTGEIVKVNLPQTTVNTKVVDQIKDEYASSVCLQEAEVIVSGGRGLGGAAAFSMLAELADLLRGAVAASRAAVDEGWLEYSHQVGQTGKTVCPIFYLACGISGAVQHLVGMQSSDIIIAINKNKEAPIFNVANYGVSADLHELIPLLIKKIRKEKGL
ncbi:electron transfer flavoprotein alpha-subunit [Candidatus Magnetoovum chiemensis]|nr:electron transfer flavoprotein alpha-subunit [Candidatus Magnetoovum chiemensis]